MPSTRVKPFEPSDEESKGQTITTDGADTSWASERAALYERLAVLEEKHAQGARITTTMPAMEEDESPPERSFELYGYATEQLLTDRLGGTLRQQVCALLAVGSLSLLQFIFTNFIFDHALSNMSLERQPEYADPLNPVVFYVNNLVNDAVPTQNVVLAVASLLLHCEWMHADSEELLATMHPLEPLFRAAFAAAGERATPQRRLLRQFAWLCRCLLLGITWCIRATLIPGLGVFGLALLFANESASDIIKDSLAVAFVFELDNALYVRLVPQRTRQRYEQLALGAPRKGSPLSTRHGARVVDMIGHLLFVLDSSMAILLYLGNVGVCTSVLGTAHPLLRNDPEFLVMKAAVHYLLVHTMARGALLAAAHGYFEYLAISIEPSAEAGAKPAPPPPTRRWSAARLALRLGVYVLGVMSSVVLTFCFFKIGIWDYALDLGTHGIFLGFHPFILGCIRGQLDQSTCQHVHEDQRALEALRCFAARSFDFSFGAQLENAWNWDEYPILAPLLESDRPLLEVLMQSLSACPSMPTG
jgi:hypothetical protein